MPERKEEGEEWVAGYPIKSALVGSNSGKFVGFSCQKQEFNSPTDYYRMLSSVTFLFSLARCPVKKRLYIAEWSNWKLTCLIHRGLGVRVPLLQVPVHRLDMPSFHGVFDELLSYPWGEIIQGREMRLVKPHHFRGFA